MRLTAAIFHDEKDKTYTARCLEVAAAGRGFSVEDALDNLRKDLEYMFCDAVPRLQPQSPIIAPITIDLESEPPAPQDLR